MNKSKNGCYGCQDRHVGCHADCPKYEAFKIENERVKHNERMERIKHQYGRRIFNNDR